MARNHSPNHGRGFGCGATYARVCSWLTRVAPSIIPLAETAKNGGRPDTEKNYADRFSSTADLNAAAAFSKPIAENSELASSPQFNSIPSNPVPRSSITPFPEPLFYWPLMCSVFRGRAKQFFRARKLAGNSASKWLKTAVFHNRLNENSL